MKYVVVVIDGDDIGPEVIESAFGLDSRDVAT
jgi:isocitrate/isopropylmalate dehydrogenase